MAKRAPRPRSAVGILSSPTSVIVLGNDRSLLKWVAFALATSSGPEYVWTDVRMRGEVLPEDDPLARHRVPAERFSSVHADELARNESEARTVNAALGGVVRADEPPDALRRIADFFRLPTHTQELLASLPRDGPPVVLVLSNGQRLVALYPTDTVAPVVGAIVQQGAVLVMTWAEAAPDGRHAFEHVYHLEGGDAKSWRRASLRVEKAPASAPLTAGTTYALDKIPSVAAVLARELG